MIPDDVGGTAAFALGAVAPGSYRAQIVVADGWTLPKRPQRHDPGAQDVLIPGEPPLGDPTDPRSLLASVMRGDERPSALTDATAQSVANEVMACAIATLEDAPPAKKPEPLLRLLAQLLFADMPTGCAQLADAVATERLSERNALRFAITALRCVRAEEEVPSATLRALWRTCAPLAAAIDVPRACSKSEAAERLAEFAGWTPGMELPAVGWGLRAGGPWTRQSADDIRSLQRDWNTPVRAASLGAYVLGSYEWVAVAKEDLPSLEAWWRKFTPREAPTVGGAHVKQRASSHSLPPWAHFPAAILGAAFHTLLRDGQSDFAEHALAAASAFAPKLVSHDLCFAIIALDAAQRAPVADPAPAEPEPAQPAVLLIAPEPEEDRRVMAAMHGWRERLRKRSSYLMFSDAELLMLARYRPRTVADMRPFLSAVKIERYGTEILRAIEDATR